MGFSRKFKKELRALVACKVSGICDRDKVATDYLRMRTKVYERRMQTVNEIVRDEANIPRCPPDCEKQDTADCEETVTVECAKEVTVKATVTGEV